MKNILLIGNNPKFTTGVTNYTRPLMEHLSDSQQYKVSYLFNDAFDNKFGKKKNTLDYRKIDSTTLIELQNSTANLYNYNELQLDYSDWFDKKIIEIFDKIKPDIVHINEIFGFSSNIIKIAKEQGIKVVITVHEYWWLCPHRVMVDYQNRICEGPSDFSKCAYCILKRMPRFGSNNERRKFFLKLKYPKISNMLQFFLKRNVKVSEKVFSFTDEEIPNSILNSDKHKKLETDISRRLQHNILNLNLSDVVIAVSSDVKNILMKYGVYEKKIWVNHIGSKVASNKITHFKKVDNNEIIFGFIGGVGYYKGVHHLVQAWRILPEEYKSRTKIYVYGKYDIDYYNYIISDILQNDVFKENVVFFGAFLPNDLEQITNTFDISVLPSLCADTAPQTIFESFNSGLPVIGPRVGGYPDFITDGKNGLLYDKESYSDLSKKMALIIENPTLINTFKENIPNLKSFEKHMEELTELYNSI